MKKKYDKGQSLVNGVNTSKAATYCVYRRGCCESYDKMETALNTARSGQRWFTGLLIWMNTLRIASCSKVAGNYIR